MYRWDLHCLRTSIRFDIARKCAQHAYIASKPIGAGAGTPAHGAAGFRGVPLIEMTTPMGATA